MIAWNPCVDSILHAINNPRFVRRNAIQKTTASVGRIARRVDRDPSERCEQQEQGALNARERRAPERLAEHDLLSADRRDEDALKESPIAILDRGDRREDRREQQHHDDHAGEEVLDVVLTADAGSRLERMIHSAAEQQPEDERLRECAHPSAALAREANDLAPPERRHREKEALIASPRLRRRSRIVGPVTCTKTSSSVGRPKLTDRTSVGNASTRSRSRSCPRAALDSQRSVDDLRLDAESRANLRREAFSGCSACTTTTSPPTLRLSSSGAPTRDEATLVQHGDAVRPLGLFHEVSREHDRDAAPSAEVEEMLEEVAPRTRIEPGARLVEQQELRLVQQPAGELGAPREPTGEGFDEVIRARRQVELAERRSRCAREARAPRRRRDARGARGSRAR